MWKSCCDDDGVVRVFSLSAPVPPAEFLRQLGPERLGHDAVDNRPQGRVGHEQELRAAVQQQHPERRCDAVEVVRLLVVARAQAFLQEHDDSGDVAQDEEQDDGQQDPRSLLLLLLERQCVIQYECVCCARSVREGQRGETTLNTGNFWNLVLDGLSSGTFPAPPQCSLIGVLQA